MVGYMKVYKTLLSTILLTGCQTSSTTVSTDLELPQNKYDNISFNSAYSELLKSESKSNDSILKYIYSYKEYDKPYRTYLDVGLPVDDIMISAEQEWIALRNKNSAFEYVFSFITIGDYSQDLNGFLLYEEEEHETVNAAGIWVIEHNKSYDSSCSSKGFCGLTHSDGYYEAQIAVDLKNWYIPMSIEKAKSFIDRFGSNKRKSPALIVFKPAECVSGKGARNARASYTDSQLITCRANVKEVHLYSADVLTSSDVPIFSLRKNGHYNKD